MGWARTSVGPVWSCCRLRRSCLVGGELDTRHQIRCSCSPCGTFPWQYAALSVAVARERLATWRTPGPAGSGKVHAAYAAFDIRSGRVRQVGEPQQAERGTHATVLAHLEEQDLHGVSRVLSRFLQLPDLCARHVGATHQAVTIALSGTSWRIGRALLVLVLQRHSTQHSARTVSASGCSGRITARM